MPIHNMHMAATSKHGGHGKHSSQNHVNQQNKKSSDNSHNKQTHYKRAGIVAGIIVGVLLIIYLAGVAFFHLTLCRTQRLQEKMSHCNQLMILQTI